MVPYLKGFHLMIEIWHDGQDSEEWRKRMEDNALVCSSASLSSLDASRAGGCGLNLDMAMLLLAGLAKDETVARVNHQVGLKMGGGQMYAPKDGLTSPVIRFKDNIAALRHLTDFELPPLQVVRPTQVVKVFYGFGDASGKQFRTTLSKNYNCKAQLSKDQEDTNGIQFCIGLWSATEEEGSLNYKELKNLVDTVSEEAGVRQLKDCK
jgi:hypothetical protein